MTPAQERIVYWRRNPVAFVRDNFGVEPDAWQVEVLEAFADPTKKRISMQACVGPGKSTALAWCGWNFLSCYGAIGEFPKGFAVAVTQDNLRANLWPEFSKWQRKSPYLSSAFTWTGERIYANDYRGDWFLEARSWPKTATPEEQGKTLSGLHGKFVLALIDESGSIPPAVLRAGDQALSSTNLVFGKIMQAGNPLSTDGMLHAAANELAHMWHVVRITGDPDDPKRSPRINIDWAREQIAAYGRDNPWVMAHILGKFPPSSLNTLLGPDEVRDAMDRSPPEHETEKYPVVLGVDVAREGDDRSVIFRRQGRRAWHPTILRNVDSIFGAGAVAREWREHRAEACFIDNTGGFGSGWLDQLRAMAHNPIGIHFAGGAHDTRYANKRAEMWFEMAQWVKEGGSLPRIPELIEELTKPLYFFKGDALQLEDKKQIKTRLGRSPDLADALALTFAEPVTSLAMEEDQERVDMLVEHRSRSQRGRRSISYNPYSDDRMDRLRGRR